MKDLTDRRRHTRLQRDDKLFIQILAASESPDAVGETLYCSTVDVSQSGLKLELTHEVAIGSEVDLWIDVKVAARKFFLRGVVRWCYELDSSESGYQIGVEIFDRMATDYHSWMELFKEAGIITQQ